MTFFLQSDSITLSIILPKFLFENLGSTDSEHVHLQLNSLGVSWPTLQGGVTSCSFPFLVEPTVPQSSSQ